MHPKSHHRIRPEVITRGFGYYIPIPKYHPLSSLPPPPPKTHITLYDEGTSAVYRLELCRLKVPVRSAVDEECAKHQRDVLKITYEGTEVPDTTTWKQLGISDGAKCTVVVTTVVSGLPPNWKVNVDPKSGETYYINYETKTKKWEFPV